MLKRGGYTGKIVGLTSPGNVAFVTGLGIFDRVVTYAAIAASFSGLAASTAVAYVDMAGNAAVNAAVHGCFGAATPDIITPLFIHELVELVSACPPLLEAATNPPTTPEPPATTTTTTTPPVADGGVQGRVFARPVGGGSIGPIDGADCVNWGSQSRREVNSNWCGIGKRA